MKAKAFLAACFLAGLTVVTATAQDRPAASSRPLVLPLNRYQCLVQYADQLQVSARGNLVDVSRCPPRIATGFVPNPNQMNDYLTLNRADLACLLRGRRTNHGIARMRGRSEVLVYLRPCGRR